MAMEFLTEGRVMKKNAVLYTACILLFSEILTAGYREKGYQYLSPVPNAEYVLPQTRFILVRFDGVSPSELTNLSSFITVTGASTGQHSGQAKVASDQKTVIFEIDNTFSSLELVTVSLSPEFSHSAIEQHQYQFMISGPMPGVDPPFADEYKNSVTANSLTKIQNEEILNLNVPATDTPPPPPDTGGARIMPNGVSIPSDFPGITITANDNPAPGYIYIDYSDSPNYTMMLDSDGSPVWYKKGSAYRDFKQQEYGIITWSNFEGYDQNFNHINSYRAVNGYNTDSHELQVLEDGHYLLFGIKSLTVDMSRFVPNGRTNARVTESVLQEFTPEGDLIFQWRSWDNFDIRLMQYWSYDDKPTSSSIRFTHMNAIDIDNDGHLVVSNKRVSEVTKVDSDTGQIIWRMGSGNPTNPSLDPYLHQRLTILNDPLPTGQFNVQHDIRVVGQNRYTLFDNHHLDNTKNSRAAEYEIDPVNRTATLVWQYMGGHDSYHMGNAQRLDNGNTLINLVIANAPKVTEVRPDGTKAFEMNWTAANSKSYRVFKFPWEGMVEVPYLLVEHHPDNVTLIMNKFGDPDVDHYNIYAGSDPNPKTLITTSDTTLKRLRDLINGQRYYFRVTAVDSHGVESGSSNEQNVVVNFVQSGQNMIINGDFLEGTNSWNWSLSGTANAQWLIEDAQSHFEIINSGTSPSDIMLSQGELSLIKGEKYVLEFDASAPQPRYMQVSAGSLDFFTPYITPVKIHFEYEFTMTEPSDYDANLVFELGAFGFDIYLDNISLTQLPPEPDGMTIAIVSECQPPHVSGGIHRDDALVIWLENHGFKVNTTCMGGNAIDSNNPFSDQLIKTTLQDSGLIIVTRHTTSGNYDSHSSSWNTLKTPLVLCSGYLTRNTHWAWAPCSSTDASPSTAASMPVISGNENHPFLKGLSNPAELFDWSTAPSESAPKGVFLPTCSFAGANSVIGTYGSASQPFLADIPANTTLSNGNISGDRRVFLGHWSYDINLSAPFNRSANWSDFITDDYKTILLNIIKELLEIPPGDFDLDGIVSVDDLIFFSADWCSILPELETDINDSGKVDFEDFLIISDNW